MNGLVRNGPVAKRAKSGLSAVNRALLYPKKQVKSQYSQRKMSQQHFQIRENQLTCMFKHRKRRLEKISKENRHIYIKINSQKSKYCRDDMNKSYRSNREISRRLERGKALSRGGSTSRLSQLSRDNSFTSKRGPKTSRRLPPKPIVCQTLDVRNIDDKRILDIKKMFLTKMQNSQKKAVSANKQNNHFDKYTLPTLEERASGILTERNKFDIIKEEAEDFRQYKTVQMSQTAHVRPRHQHRIPNIFCL